MKRGYLTHLFHPSSTYNETTEHRLLQSESLSELHVTEVYKEQAIKHIHQKGNTGAMNKATEKYAAENLHCCIYS